MSIQIRSSIWMITGFLACPCHLPLTIPLILGLTAGTAVGAFLVNNIWLVAGISTAYFIVSMLFAFRLFKRQPAAELPKANDADTEFACCNVDLTSPPQSRRSALS